MNTGFTKQKQGQFRHFGRVLYGAGLLMQRGLADYVRDGDCPDQILLLEHNPVFTLGRSATRSDVHVSDEFLTKNGVELHRTDRGGQVTYHGPGQIVVYPICNLRGGRQDVGRLVRGLEQAMINASKDFGVTADRLEGYPGIWVKTAHGLEKLGAVGIHLKRWVSTHGIAFNIDPCMSHFQWITPCGITDKGVCSLRTLLGNECPTWNEVGTSLAFHLSEILALNPVPVAEPSQSISVTVWRRGNSGLEILMLLRCLSEGRWWSNVTEMIEPGETPEIAAHREVLEETGLSGNLAAMDFQHSFWLEPTICGVCGDEPQFNTEICFHMEVPADSQASLITNEHNEYRWCAPSEALKMMSRESSKAALNKLLTTVAVGDGDQ
ncbi:MAG: lipoyl(octanoyl) transferase LipB [Holophagales bacterium]|jgi:lipoyl(octanoyl) transferase|nr:lipoyl(octanoyl) transferase LipB [Holophagales bacterium]